MVRTVIKSIVESKVGNGDLLVKGWVRNRRGSKNVQFIALNDGSCLGNLQVVVDIEKFDESILKKISVGAALAIEGKLEESSGNQSFELIAEKIDILGEANPETYPIQPKKHSMEFLRENAHLRMRTNTFSAVFRVRHYLSHAIHQFFHQKGYYHLHTPIITASDCEGAGEMFRVSTFEPNQFPKDESGHPDYSQDFFGKATNLTVSGQLEGETGAMALGGIYTFGPTFRAENSNTTRHLAEFWMVEPEVAFNTLKENRELAEEFLKYCIQYALDNCPEDLQFLQTLEEEREKLLPENQRNELPLLEKLKFVTQNDFVHLTYTEAIDVLLKSNHYKKGKFEYDVKWGIDLQSEHERYLVEKEFKKPVILTDYPKDIKAFYMKQNEDGKTVAAMDILFPGIGEIIGGSERESNLEKLEKRMIEMDINPDELWWYLDTRRFGTAPHAGFGLGFERLVLFVTGMTNIRDVIPFPRTPKNAEF